MADNETLINQACRGDIKTFHQLFGGFQGQLRSYLYRLTADRNDAEDLTHDAFVKAFDKIASFQGKSSLKTWVFTIATNLALDLLRKRKRWPVDAQDQSREASRATPEEVNLYLHLNQFSPHGTYEIREHIDFCFTCITKTLPIDQQIALLLKDVYEFKVKEITMILAKSTGVVKHLLHNARQTMRDIFDDRCSLVNKNGVCYQCSELNGLFNPKQQAQEEVIKLELVKAAERSDSQTLLELRTKLVKSIDPLDAAGSDLHDAIMQRIRTVIDDV
jgi:RNA polymerase sigma-70 factor (ECF subfamily)